MDTAMEALASSGPRCVRCNSTMIARGTQQSPGGGDCAGAAGPQTRPGVCGLRVDVRPRGPAGARGAAKGHRTRLHHSHSPMGG